MSWVKGYKAFNKVAGNDKAGECRGFVYEEGHIYEIDDSPKVCGIGFHACKEWVLCLSYYPDHENNVYAEVELLGGIDYEEPTKHKASTNKIKIIRFINCCFLDGDNSGYYNSGNYNSGNCNSGNRNSGNYNSGNYNSGNRNSGDYNSGYRNSGDCNSGDYNSGDYNSGNCNSGDYNSGDYNSGYRNIGSWNSCNNESGFFNSTQSEYIMVFNKPCKRVDWNNSIKPRFIYFEIDFDIGYKASFLKSYQSATKSDIELLKNLPNFDPDVFFDISGIKIE